MARCSPGVGTNLHLLGELIKSEEKLNLTHVPYRNFGTAFQDAMAGRVDLVVAGLPPVAELVAAKKLKVLVTTAPARVSALLRLLLCNRAGSVMRGCKAFTPSRQNYPPRAFRRRGRTQW
jgi:hypothetical protein